MEQTTEKAAPGGYHQQEGQKGQAYRKEGHQAPEIGQEA